MEKRDLKTDRRLARAHALRVRPFRSTCYPAQNVLPMSPNICSPCPRLYIHRRFVCVGN